MSYHEHRNALIAYMKAKIDIGDWHAVRDAAVDIEILEAKNAALADFELPALLRKQAE